MRSGLRFFDAHLHADGLSDHDLESMVLFGMRGALVPARDAVCSDAKEYEEHFLSVLHTQQRRLQRFGLKAYGALGIPPARIPWHGVERILAAIPRLARKGRLVAIGQIGLEQGTPREEQTFERQLQLALELNLPVMVATPERDKARVTRRALAILRQSGLKERSVLVQHADRQTLRTILGCGFWAGLTVNPMRLTAEEAVALIHREGSEGIVLASDAGDGVHDILSLPRTAALLEAKGLGGSILRRVLGENALRLFRIGRELLA